MKFHIPKRQWTDDVISASLVFMLLLGVLQGGKKKKNNNNNVVLEKENESQEAWKPNFWNQTV